VERSAINGAIRERTWGRERRNSWRFLAAGEASGRGRLAAATREGGRERRGPGGPHLAVRGRRGTGARRFGSNGSVSVSVFLFSI
jgi:hypothetical protein